MHSSRMRTTHLLPVSPSMHCSWGVPAQGLCLSREVYLLRRGVLAQGGVPGQEGCTCPGGVPAQGGVPARVVYLPRGVTCPGGVPAQGECTCPGGVPAWGVPAQVLPRCGQTDTCKNITFANLRAVIISKYIKVYKQSRTSDK